MEEEPNAYFLSKKMDIQFAFNKSLKAFKYKDAVQEF